MEISVDQWEFQMDHQQSIWTTLRITVLEEQTTDIGSSSARKFWTTESFDISCYCYVKISNGSIKIVSAS